MAIRTNTNTKRAKENIKNYIKDHFTPDNYDIEMPDTFEDIAKIIYADFVRTSYYNRSYAMAHRISEQTLFVEWCSGLPGVLDTCYYYNRSAVDDLGTVLEETEEEKAKYTESQAEQMLTYLIYREIKNAL